LVYLIQGEHCETLRAAILKEGYTVKIAGG